MFSIIPFVSVAIAALLVQSSADGRASESSAEVARLVRALKSSDQNVRQDAVRALGRMRSAAAPAVSALTTALRDPPIAADAANALADIGPPAASAVPALMRALKTPGEHVEATDLREEAARALGKLHAVRASSALVAAFLDEDWRVASAARDALAEIGRPAIPILIRTMRQPNDDGAAGYAFDAVVRMGGLAVPALIEALADRSAYLRGNAIDALGFIGPDARAAVPALKRLLPGADPATAREIQTALQKIER